MFASLRFRYLILPKFTLQVKKPFKSKILVLDAWQNGLQSDKLGFVAESELLNPVSDRRGPRSNDHRQVYAQSYKMANNPTRSYNLLLNVDSRHFTELPSLAKSPRRSK